MRTRTLQGVRIALILLAMYSLFVQPSKQLEKAQEPSIQMQLDEHSSIKEDVMIPKLPGPFTTRPSNTPSSNPTILSTTKSPTLGLITTNRPSSSSISPSSSPSTSPSTYPSSSPSTSPYSSPSPSSILRYDWTNMTLYSDQAKEIYAHQHNCSLPWIQYNVRQTAYGLGSELHVWSYALNESVKRGYRIRTVHEADKLWDWIDQDSCANYSREFGKSQLDCYFPDAEPTCTTATTMEMIQNNATVENQIDCSPNNPDTVAWRAASMEYLFTTTSTLVVKEAERQVRAVFGNDNNTLHAIPDNLILVHMRWGDKFTETTLFTVNDYIREIQTIVTHHNLTQVNILLCTEDPDAVAKFYNNTKLLGWNVYMDHFYTEFEPYRLARPPRPYNLTEFNVVANVAQDLRGKPGLWALGSLLVAMESKYYILTLSSNWSRLYNELRKAIVDPRCNNCTVMVDLSNGGEC